MSDSNISYIPSTTGTINQNSTGGQFTIGQNSIGVPFNWQWNYPYGYHSYYQYNWVTINKAENGFVVIKDGKTFVASTPEEIVKLLIEVK